MKKFFVILAVILVLGSVFVIPAFALTQYRVQMVDVSGDYFSGVYFKSDIDSDWSTGYITNDSRTANFEFSLDCKVLLLSGSDYTGCFLKISRSEFGEDITANVVNVTADEWGNIYIPNETVFQLYLTVYPPTIYYFTCIPVNYPDYVSSQGGYLAGYRQGKADGYTDCYNNKYLPALQQIEDLQNLIDSYLGDDFDLEAYADSVRNQAYAEAIEEADMVPNVLVSVFNSIGRIFGQFLTFNIFGIPIFAIVLVLALIPLGLALAKLFMSHGG